MTHQERIAITEKPHFIPGETLVLWEAYRHFMLENQWILKKKPDYCSLTLNPIPTYPWPHAWLLVFISITFHLHVYISNFENPLSTMKPTASIPISYLLYPFSSSNLPTASGRHPYHAYSFHHHTIFPHHFLHLFFFFWVFMAATELETWELLFRIFFFWNGWVEWRESTGEKVKKEKKRKQVRTYKSMACGFELVAGAL